MPSVILQCIHLFWLPQGRQQVCRAGCTDEEPCCCRGFQMPLPCIGCLHCSISFSQQGWAQTSKKKKKNSCAESWRFNFVPLRGMEGAGSLGPSLLKEELPGHHSSRWETLCWGRLHEKAAPVAFPAPAEGVHTTSVCGAPLSTFAFPSPWARNGFVPCRLSASSP